MYRSDTSGSDTTWFSVNAGTTFAENRLALICSRLLPQQLILVFSMVKPMHLWGRASKSLQQTCRSRQR